MNQGESLVVIGADVYLALGYEKYARALYIIGRPRHTTAYPMNTEGTKDVLGAR